MPLLHITVEPKRVAAGLVRRGRTVWAAESAYADASDLVQVLAQLAAERPQGVRRARGELGPGVARLKTVEGLPAVSRGDLAAHVRLHSRRYFIQNGIPLVTDAASTASGPLLAAAPAPLVEAVVSGLAAAGLECAALTPSGAPQLSLLPDEAKRRSRDRDARSLRRLAAAAALSVVLAAAAWVGSLLRAERGAREQLARLGPGAEAALAVRRDLEAVTTALTTLASAEPVAGGLVTLLARVTAALPDSAFLASIRLDSTGVVRLTGYARSAPRVLAQMERIAGATGAALDGPTMREVVGGREWERFAITFRIVRR
jgi:hypothetical protein